MNGRSILWTDNAGTTHSCVRAEAVKGEFLVWTNCQKDVPPEGRAFGETWRSGDVYRVPE
jgi:hypothetical protein